MPSHKAATAPAGGPRAAGRGGGVVAGEKKGGSGAGAREKAGGSPPGGLAAAASALGDGVLCPGVRLAPTRPEPPAKRKRSGLKSDSDSDVGDGYGSEIQTLKKDIDHLRELYPGEYPRPPRPFFSPHPLRSAPAKAGRLASSPPPPHPPPRPPDWPPF